LSLAQILSDDFSLSQRTKGRCIYNAGGVRIASCDDDEVRASVTERRGLERQVSIAWLPYDDTQIFVDCGCDPAYTGGFCQHVWATLLAMDGRRLGPTFDNGNKASLEVDALLDRHGSNTPHQGTRPIADWKQALDAHVGGTETEPSARPFWGASARRGRHCRNGD
jgi:uncharacterized Zn finger protein